ncbi:hypothetical protein L9F63_018088, partial [Diploptera punctata]
LKFRGIEPQCRSNRLSFSARRRSQRTVQRDSIEDDSSTSGEADEVDDDGRVYKNPRNSPSALCPRDEMQATLLGQKCLRKCSSDEDCKSKKKKCLCDGACGMSCIKPEKRSDFCWSLQRSTTFQHKRKIKGLSTLVDAIAKHHTGIRKLTEPSVHRFPKYISLALYFDIFLQWRKFNPATPALLGHLSHSIRVLLKRYHAVRKQLYWCAVFLTDCT